MKNFDQTWNNAKKQLLKNWSALSLEELERTHGDKTALTELIQNKYGIAHEQAVAAVYEVIPDFEGPPPLPSTEKPAEPDEFRKIEGDERPVYPNKLYEEELPPEIQLNNEE